MEKVRVHVDGLACPFCAFNIEKRLLTLEGVTGDDRIDVSIPEGLVTLKWRPDVTFDPEAVNEQILRGGFVREFGEEGDTEGRLRRPTGVAVGPDGAVYVADAFRDKIFKFTDTGEFILEWGEPGEGGDQFETANGITVDASGNVYVADFQNMAIKIFDQDGHFLHQVGGQGEFHYPTDVVMAEGESFFVADAYGYKIQAVEVEGIGNKEDARFTVGVFSPPEDNGFELNVPSGIVWHSANGLLHVADSGNRRLVMLDGDGRLLSEWALPEQTEEYSLAMVAVSPDGNRVYATDIAKNRVIGLLVK